MRRNGGMRTENRLIFLSLVACIRDFFFKGENICIRANLEFMLTVDTQKIVSFLPSFYGTVGCCYFS